MRYTKKKVFRIDERCEQILRKNVEKLNKTSDRKITESEYLRELIKYDNLEKRTYGIDTVFLHNMYRVLFPISNNLNQIAHRINTGMIDQKDINKIKDMEELIEIIEDELRTLVIAFRNGE